MFVCDVDRIITFRKEVMLRDNNSRHINTLHKIRIDLMPKKKENKKQEAQQQSHSSVIDCMKIFIFAGNAMHNCKVLCDSHI